MKRRYLSFLLILALFLSAVACGGEPVQEQDEPPVGTLTAGDTTPLTDGNWELTGEWSILREEDGDEILSVRTAGTTRARNTFFRLLDEWTVWTDVQVSQFYDEEDELGLIFTDSEGETLISVSVHLSGGKAYLTGETLTQYGTKEILSSGTVDYDPTLPLNLKAVHLAGTKRITASLSQQGQELLSAETRSIASATFTALLHPGLTATHTESSFADFSVQAEKKTVDTNQPISGIFEAEENVPTEDWILGEGAVHNLINDKSALIIEGTGQSYAWNCAETLGDEWTLSFLTEYGRSSREVGCARYIFGAEAQMPGDILGIVTVNYTNNAVNLTVQDKDGGSWITTATSMGWVNVKSRIIRVEISKYAGINRLAIFLYDGADLVYSTFTDEMRPEQMAQYRRFGCMVYASQVRFSGFGKTDTANYDLMPSMEEKVYPHVNVLEVPAGERTNDWELSRSAVFFREEGKDALSINAKGEEYCYYLKNTISGAWACSTRLNFGTYYGESAGLRISFTTTDKRYAALLSVSYNPAGGAYDIQLQSYIPETDGWTDLLRSGWQPGPAGTELFLSGDGEGGVTVCLKEAGSGKVVYENTVTLDEASVKNMKVIGFAAMNAQTKFSAITMELTGGRVQMAADPSQKTMYALTTGTPATTDEWVLGEGITYNTEGALILRSKEGLYSANQKTVIYDGFDITTDLLFGDLDAQGCSTPRIALTDEGGNLLVLISVKFAQNFFVMVTGQYNDGQWHSPLNDGQWREVTDNRVHLRLSRQPDSRVLSLQITDFAGRSVYSATMELPASLSARISRYSLGIDNSGVKFSNINCTLSGRDSASEDPEDFGLIPIPEGETVASDRWTAAEGVSTRSDGSVLLEGDSVFTTDRNLVITNDFRLSADIQYGSIDGNGVSTARLALTDSQGGQAVLFSFKYSVNGFLEVTGQYQKGAWVSCVKNTAWTALQDNRIHVDLERTKDETALKLTVWDYSGREIFSELCPIPRSVAQSVSGYALGVDHSTVLFSEIYGYAGDTLLPDGPDEEEEPPVEDIPDNVIEPVGWTGGDGVYHLSDGSIQTFGQGDVFTYCTGTPLGESYALQTDLRFAGMGGDGTATSRIVLAGADYTPIGLLSLKLDGQNSLLITLQLYYNGNWSTVLSADWMNVGTDQLRVRLSRGTGETVWKLQISATDGAVLYTGTSASILPEALAQIRYLGLGTYSSRIEYRNISLETT